MKKIFSLLAVLMLITACAGTPPVEEKPSIAVSRSVSMNAVVEAINHDTREVTLRGQGDKTVSFVASEEARNLGQVQVGDIVVAEYIESLNIDVVTVEGASATAAESSVIARSKEGEMPGVTTIDAVVVTAIVEDINIEANTFKLKDSAGNIREYTARDPENLKKAAVGDSVVITYIQAIALSVKKAE